MRYHQHQGSPRMKTCPLCSKSWPSNHTSCPTDGVTLIDSGELEPGTIIRGKYRIQRLLGRGGMGAVYLAEHILLARPRALKFISGTLTQDPAFLRRFRREALAAIELRHPNVVEVVDLDQAEDGAPYIAMEFVDGPDLRHALTASYSSNDRHPERSAAESKDLHLHFEAFPVTRALWITRGIAQGLAAAHAKGIIHRDVKPENILLSAANTPAETPKLFDFGIAAIQESVTAITRTRGLMLTPPYASPEQWRGVPADQLDGRADLYALGGVLYEMLTGQTPFHAHNSEGWMFQHLQEQPQPPSHLRSELANWPGLDALVLRLLAKDRELRPNDAAELVGMLDAVRYLSPEAHLETVSLDAARAEKQREITCSGRVPVWVWAASILMLLVAAIAAGRVFWPKPPATTRSGVTGVPPGLVEEPLPQAQPSSQPASTPAFQWDDQSHTTQAQPSSQPASTPAAGGWQISDSPTPPQPSTQEPNSATDPYAAIAKPPGSPQPSSQPTSKGGLAPWEEEPSNAEAEKLAMRFYNQHCSKEAAPLFKQACSGGIAEGCWFLGIMYGTGQGVPKSEATAVALLSKACDAGMAIGCYDAALGYTSGKGIGKDYQRAALLYSKACDADIGPACSNLSDIYALGAGGIEPDIPRAQELARKACTVKKIPPSACSIPEIKQ